DLADALTCDVLGDRVGEMVLAAGAERLVDEPEHAPLLDVDPPPTDDVAGVLRRRRVEGPRTGRAPVDRQQPVGLVGDRVAADVQRAAVRAVDAPEVERTAGRVI